MNKAAELNGIARLNNMVKEMAIADEFQHDNSKFCDWLREEFWKKARQGEFKKEISMAYLVDIWNVDPDSIGTFEKFLKAHGYSLGITFKNGHIERINISW